MRLPQNVPSNSDRISTREELFEVIEVLGGFDEPQGTDLAQTTGLLACLRSGVADSSAEILRELSNGEEQVLLEMEPLAALMSRKAEPVN
jgi:hypothetical protein